MTTTRAEDSSAGLMLEKNKSTLIISNSPNVNVGYYSWKERVKMKDRCLLAIWVL